jgi:polysaccharide export outer membrane protein
MRTNALRYPVIRLGHSPFLRLPTLAVLAAFVGCAQLPTSGPHSKDIQETQSQAAAATIQVVDVDSRVTSQLLSQRRQPLFSDVFGSKPGPQVAIGPGDSIEITIWEAPPATLFGGGSVDARSPSTVRAMTLPEQMVDREGFVSVPFAGRILAAGKNAPAVEAEVRQALKGKANQPEVLVRVLRVASATVTVVGEVGTSLRMPLTAGGERLLDALAAAGGVRQPVNRMTLQVTRGTQLQALPLDQVIRDPLQNVPLHAGDVVTALFQPLSFTALGATGRNEEIAFETQGISLAQALGRAGGLVDSRASAQGVFVFRLEPESALDWPRKPVSATPDGRVPVVYRFDLRDPASFFVMQSFQLSNKDVLYVSNAPVAELQKFLNLVFSVVYPVLTTIQVTR